jgi:hypothetical protein
MPAGHLPHGYGSLYINIARYPELGLFRRLGAYWAKKVHDDTSEFLASLENVNRELGALHELGENSILDCPKRVVRMKCPEGPERYKALYLAWSKYDECLLQYGEAISVAGAFEADGALGQTLAMSEQIMKLPCQDAYYTKHLAEFKMPNFKDLFVDNICVPTGERATSYQDLTEKVDTCAWATLTKTDFLTMRFIHSSKWIEKHILSRLRRCFPPKKASDPRIQTDMRHGRIVGVMDTLTCLVASILLTASVLALASLRPIRVRVALVGVFGTLFSLALKLMAGDITRGEVFAATAAFYAVAVVFVGTTTIMCAPQ